MAKQRGVLLIATKKGAFLLAPDAGRRKWALKGPFFLGSMVHHVMLDPRDRRTLLATARTGHLGPTVFRSRDLGRNWKEAAQPPAFPKANEGEQGRSVKHVFWLTPGHASEPGVWYAGTSPQGLFRSEDGGDHWQPVAGFNDHPQRAAWTGPEQGGTPDGPTMHSILIDPRDARHMYIGMSSGGVFETLDQGQSWTPLNKGVVADFLPMPEPEFGHDPHCVRLHPLAPDVLYQQNHCGIYRIERPSNRWERIGDNMPKKVGDVGFPIVLHPRDPNTAWVFPMDGTGVWPRTCPDGKPAIFVTHNGGKRWQKVTKGLPERGWLTVLRQAMTVDQSTPVGLYFGTTTGQVYGSRDEGKSFRCIAEHLPHIYAVESAEL